MALNIGNIPREIMQHVLDFLSARQIFFWMATWELAKQSVGWGPMGVSPFLDSAAL